MIEDELLNIIDAHASAPHPAQWNTGEIFENLKIIIPVSNNLRVELEETIRKGGEPEVLRQELSSVAFEAMEEVYEEREKKLGREKMRELETFLLLRTLDMLWMDHLDTMEHLRDSVRLRAYAQKDPLVEYKREGLGMFERLLDDFQTQVVDAIFKVELQSSPQPHRVELKETNESGSASAAQGETVKTLGHSLAGEALGRNDPCHCGAKHSDGRPIKYKHCHGKSA